MREDRGTTPPRPLISERRLRSRVASLARRVSRDHERAGDLLVVGVLTGAYVFLADLARRLTVPHAVDFLTCTHYGAGRRSSGRVGLVADLRAPVRGRPVLVVEDIVDTGHTLARVLELLRGRRPSSLRSCSLLSKPSRREAPVVPDYVGFEIPDVWVAGYGMDSGGRWRSLPYVGVVEPAPRRTAAGEAPRNRASRS